MTEDTITKEEFIKHLSYERALRGDFDDFDDLTGSQEDISWFLRFAVASGYCNGLDKNTWEVIQRLDRLIDDSSRPNLEDLIKIKDEIIEIKQSIDMSESDEIRLKALFVEYASCLVKINHELRRGRSYWHDERQENFDKFCKGVQDATKQVFDSSGEGVLFKFFLKRFIMNWAWYLMCYDKQSGCHEIFIDLI